jgi:hypothetical protein
VGCFAIAQSARFCKEVQRPCTSVWDGGDLVRGVRRPVYRGLRLRKPAADGVFVFGTVHIRCESMTTRPNRKTAVRPSPWSSPVFCGIAQHHHEFSGIQYRFRGRERNAKADGAWPFFRRGVGKG